MVRKEYLGAYDMPPLLEAAINNLAHTAHREGATLMFLTIDGGKVESVHLFGLGNVDGSLVEPNGGSWAEYEWVDDDA